MIPPDCTLVTGCFNLFKYNSVCLSTEQITAKIQVVMELPVYMVIYTNMAELVREIRNKNGLQDFTHIIETELENIWTFQYAEKVRKNREEYFPTKDKRTCVESHLVCCNKFQFVLDTMEQNYFSTAKFAWIDSFLSIGKRLRICEDYNINKILYVLNNFDSTKFHIQILNPCEKKYLLEENKREYYSKYRFVVCGGFFACGKEIGVKVLRRVNETFIKTTELGYGHGDEMFFPEALEEFYDDVHRSYGDYGQIINNFIRPSANIQYIYGNIINKSLALNYYKECYDCCKVLLDEIENYQVSMDYSVYLRTLYDFYVSSFYHKPEETVNICNHLYDVCFRNPYMMKEFNKTREFYIQQLALCNTKKKSLDIAFCVFGCHTIECYREQIRSIQQTWGVNAYGISNVAVFFFLGDDDAVDVLPEWGLGEYIYLKGVKNDVASAADKQTRGFKYIYENYNAKYVFCCGTDTFVNVDKLHKTLNQYDCEKALYIGGHGDTRTLGDSFYFHSGGAGFILTRKTMEIIYMHLDKMVSDWKKICIYEYEYLIPACDVMIAYYLHKLCAVEIISLDEGFYGCNWKGFAGEFSCCASKIETSKIITCHYMSLEDMRAFHSLLHHCGVKSDT